MNKKAKTAKPESGGSAIGADENSECSEGEGEDTETDTDGHQEEAQPEAAKEAAAEKREEKDEGAGGETVAKGTGELGHQPQSAEADQNAEVVVTDGVKQLGANKEASVVVTAENGWKGLQLELTSMLRSFSDPTANRLSETPKWLSTYASF
jgi:hypothetical protein